MVKRKRRSRGSNLLLLLPIAILAFAIVWFTLPQAAPVGPMPEADAHLLVTMAGWSPNHFEAKVGVPTTVMLMTSASEASMSDNVHSFVLNATNTSVFVNAGDSKTFTITFPRAGAYTFWCVTCCGGTDSPSMAGTVVVT